MSELINIWREIGAYNRFAETKLAFFIGLVLAILSVENSATPSANGPITLLKGGNYLIVNIFAIVSLLMAAAALVPQLRSITCFDWLIPRSKASNPFYFISIANSVSSREWLQAYGLTLSETETARAALLAEQIYVLAKITSRKFSVLRYALILLGAGWLLSWLHLLQFII